MSSPHPPSCRDPFDDVLDAVVSGDATERDHILLNETLRIDPEARRTYIRTMAFEAMLAREFAPLEQSEPEKIPTFRNWRTPLSIAATILLGAGLAWHFTANPPAESGVADAIFDEDEITHAVITSLDSATGRFGTASLVAGLRLAGGLIELDSGFAEITFDTGAELTLEGPARLLLESQNKTRLNDGRAAAYVPEQARGFVIHTPSSYIRDRGTSFAVEVRDGRETDLHVLEGEVEVAATGRSATRQPKILRQKEAIRLSGGNMRPIDFKAENPRQNRKRYQAKIPPSVHWSFDVWDQNITTDSTRGHILRILKNDRNKPPDIIDGPFGKAVHFDGNGTYALSTYPGVGGSQARTVAFWINIEPGDASNTKKNHSSIISWGVNRSTAKWQLAWNSSRLEGNVGAPRVDFGKGSVVGSTDLRDGRWHHLAVVYFGGPRANVATHIRIYVDGKLETLTGRNWHKIKTDTHSADAQPLTIGRFLGTSAGSKTRSFRGDLDELHVFEGPLLPGQIVRLMNRNSPRRSPQQ